MTDCLHDNTARSIDTVRCLDCGESWARAYSCMHYRARDYGGVFSCPDCDATLDTIKKPSVEPKPRPDLIPPESLIEIGRVLAWGEKERGPEKWRGQGVRGNLASATRHTLEHLAGRYDDPETGRPHLAHAGARILFALALHLEGKRE